jgi:oligosaccharyltransferase complex subunit gamma
MSGLQGQNTVSIQPADPAFFQLGLQTAPVLLLFQPTTGPHAVAGAEALRFDFSTG